MKDDRLYLIHIRDCIARIANTHKAAMPNFTGTR